MGGVEALETAFPADERARDTNCKAVAATEEALAAGFVFDGWSDLHDRCDDELVQARRTALVLLLAAASLSAASGGG